MKTLDDLKREVAQCMGCTDIPFFEQKNGTVTLRPEQLISKTIDHLHAQGRILPDDYVAVPKELPPLDASKIRWEKDEPRWSEFTKLKISSVNYGCSPINNGVTYIAHGRTANFLINDPVLSAAQKGDGK